MDFVGPFPSGENLLLLVDYYSRYPEVEIMKHITAAALEPRLRRIFARYGVPQEIVTDNAKTFRSSRFSNLMREFGMKHRRITPRYPRANGEAEWLNRSINQQGGENRNCRVTRWRKTIDDWLLAYRTTPHTVTGQPPAATMFGRNVDDKLPSLQPSAPIKINRTSYRQQDARNKQKEKNYHDAKRKAQDCSIKVGDQVLIRSEKKEKVALPWRANPFLVRAVKGDSKMEIGSASCVTPRL